MIFRFDIRLPAPVRRASSLQRPSLVRIAAMAGALALGPGFAQAAILDFGAALQPLPAGQVVTQVTLANGGTMWVTAENRGSGPDECIVFDSAHPTGGDLDLGTPNEDFDGPGEGEGGAEGQEGENAVALGKLLIIPADGTDDNGDGLVDVPDDESHGGLIRLRFSHAGRLSFKVVDVDKDEDEPQFTLYKEGHEVAHAQGDEYGDNGVQWVDLSEYGDIDLIEIRLYGSAGIAAIQLDVVTVGTQTRTWSNVKTTYR